jgi:hypothetical protein
MSVIDLHLLYVYVFMCTYMCGCVCVLCEKLPNFFQKKSANKIYHEKIRQKLSVVVPQLSAVLLRVRPPSCSSSQFL